jgi:hypothetical protein
MRILRIRILNTDESEQLLYLEDQAQRVGDGRDDGSHANERHQGLTPSHHHQPWHDKSSLLSSSINLLQQSINLLQQSTNLLQQSINLLQQSKNHIPQ